MEGTVGTAVIVPRWGRVVRATVRVAGREEKEVALPDGTTDATACAALDSLVLREAFRRDPGACFAWTFCGPTDCGEMLVLRVPEDGFGGLDWERAERELKEWAGRRRRKSGAEFVIEEVTS